MEKIKRLAYMLLLTLVASCTSGESKSKATKKKEAKPKFKITAPAYNTHFKASDTIKIAFTIDKAFDSVQLYVSNELQYSFRDTATLLPTHALSLGEHRLLLKAFKNGKSYASSTVIKLKSNVTPAVYGYKIVHTYPHDKTAYTQGLVYQDGIFYESTGQWGQSSLRKVNIKTGEVIQKRDVPNKYFAEGIAVFDDKIMQLTYKQQVAFLYDKESFEKLTEIPYSNYEGWGLTYNGTHLIMSDGSHKLYFYKPESFTIDRVIEVYDQNGAYTRLNELEYVNGTIWANRYGFDYLIQIDPKQGKVLGTLDLSTLLTPADRHPTLDVLNGIAYNSTQNTWYVTGKNWPKLFEIEIYKKD